MLRCFCRQVLQFLKKIVETPNNLKYFVGVDQVQGP